MKKRIEHGYRDDKSRLFLEVDATTENIKVLDYTFDHEYIHQKCGGKRFYVSHSGTSGAGYIRHWEDLIPVGYYRVDLPACDYPIQFAENFEIGEGEIEIMLPYAIHQPNKDYLKDNPIVIRLGKNGIPHIIFCSLPDLGRIIREIKYFFAAPEYGLQINDSIFKKWSQRFWNPNTENIEEFSVNFFNAFGGYAKQTPLEFCLDRLKPYRALSEDYFYEKFGLVRNYKGIFRTLTISNHMFYVEQLESDPLNEFKETLAGWKPADSVDEVNVAYRFNRSDVELLAWTSRLNIIDLLPKQFDKATCREFLANKMLLSKGEIIPASLRNKYVFTSVKIDKLTFCLNKKDVTDIQQALNEELEETAEYLAENFLI